VSVLLYDVADGIATLTLNRPDNLNALSEDLSRALQEAIARAASDEAVRCVVITGSGRGFCSGADLGGLDLKPGERIPVASILRRNYNPIILGITRMPKPVVASINGVAAGAGASLALACDFRIASDKSRMFQAFIKLGLVPDSGAHWFLERLVGHAKAAELALLGDIIDAATCERFGLVTKVVPHDDLEKETRAFAEQLASGPTVAYGLTKKGLLYAAEHDLEKVLDYEADLQDIAAMTEDNIEGVVAFLQKRPPNFKGR
jgi:2-(1,2-epoxy-1,2-dihydrophenyl)acetyl-CoA isomerase